ncbi:hypothetical protein DRO29_05395 [Candidatus Bathyarchaeota archaeon]|nr:MAG: hypothetical protein DRO29_05395 [Candidatus Bathyarchaeota archaeon]
MWVVESCRYERLEDFVERVRVRSEDGHAYYKGRVYTKPFDNPVLIKFRFDKMDVYLGDYLSPRDTFSLYYIKGEAQLYLGEGYVSKDMYVMSLPIDSEEELGPSTLDGFEKVDESIVLVEESGNLSFDVEGYCYVELRCEVRGCKIWVRTQINDRWVTTRFVDFTNKSGKIVLFTPVFRNLKIDVLATGEYSCRFDAYATKYNVMTVNRVDFSLLGALVGGIVGWFASEGFR